MANYATLISAIQEVITANGNNEITGPILQQTLVSIINSLGSGYQFIGIATPSTTPGTPDQKVFYIGSAGTYPNFGPAVIPDGSLGIFYYDSSWHYGSVAFPLGDGSVTESKLSVALLNKLLQTGYKYIGIATTSTNPSTPDQNVFYLAGAGTYQHFNNVSIPDGYLGVLYYNGSWNLSTVKVSVPLANDFLGGIDRALSAEMGKYLYDIIIGGNVEQLMDLTGYSLIGYFINNNQNWSTTGTSSNQSNGILIPVRGATGITKIKMSRVGSGWFTFLRDNTTGNNVTPHYASGYSGRVNIVDDTLVLDVPENAAYLYIITRTSTNVDVLPNWSIYDVKAASGVVFRDQIVDSLESTLTDAPLSARQGNVLKELLYGNYSEQLMDLTGYSLIGYFINNNQNWSTTGTSSNQSNGILIPVGGATGITKIKMSRVGSGWFTFLRDSYTANNQPPHYAAGYSGRVNIVDDTLVLDVPANAAYLYIITRTSTNVDVLPNWSIYDVKYSSGVVFRDQIVDNLESTLTDAPLSAKQGNVLKNMITGSGYKIHPVTQFGESRNGTITTVYDSEYTKIDIERFRGKNIFVNNIHSSTGCSQILSENNTVLSTFAGAGSTVGIVNVPLSAKWFVISNSFIDNPDFYISVPSDLALNDGLIFGDNFLYDYELIDFSQFNGTIVAGNGLQLLTGINNGLVIDKVIALDNWSLVADVLTNDNSESFALGTKITQPGAANHSTRVEIDFNAATISLYNNSTGTLVTSANFSTVINGNLYTVKLERINRAIKATITNRKTNGSVSIESPDYAAGTGNEGINPAGKMFDSPIFYVISGTLWLQNIYATCLRNAKVLIVGDSITAGAHTTYETSWAPMAAEYFGNSISGGRGSGQVLCCLNQLRTLLPAIKPKSVVVTIGTNYINNISKSGYKGLFLSIINIIKSFGAIPIINNVPACNARKTGLTIINEVVDELKQIGCRFDLATSLNNNWADGQDNQYYYSDLVHLNVAGNALLYNVITSLLGWLKNL